MSSIAMPCSLATSLNLLAKSSEDIPTSLSFDSNKPHCEPDPKVLRKFVSDLAMLDTNPVNLEGTPESTRLFLTSLIRSRKALNNSTNGPFCSTNGETNSAPILANADLTFDIAPVNVSLAFLACSPNALSIALANISKLICPFETISLTSVSVFPKYSAIVAAAFIPLDES